MQWRHFDYFLRISSLAMYLNGKGLRTRKTAPSVLGYKVMCEHPCLYFVLGMPVVEVQPLSKKFCLAYFDYFIRFYIMKFRAIVSFSRF